jgi:hypothetical protein
MTVTLDYYKSIQGYFDWEHLYDEIAEALPDGGRFCEIGCWKGQSLSYLLMKLLESGKRVEVCGVDHFQGSVEDPKLRHWAGKFDIQSICRENLDDVGYPYQLIAKPSAEAASEFDDGFFDCVYVDGSHDKDSVMEDLRAWMPKVAKGGLLAGHDINQAGVREALHELLDEKQLKRLRESPRPKELGGFKWGLSWKLPM